MNENTPLSVREEVPQAHEIPEETLPDLIEEKRERERLSQRIGFGEGL